MKDNKVISLLKSFSTEELRWFQKFVQSPYHNSNKDIVTLFGLLRKQYPDFNPVKLSQEWLWKKLFGKEEFRAPHLRLLFHRLANLLESFIVNEKLKAGTILFDKTLVYELGNRNVFTLFEKKNRQLLEGLDKEPVRDEAYYRNKMDVHLSYYSHPATERHHRGMDDLTEAMEGLDNYFALAKLKLSTAFNARKNVLSITSEVKYLETVLQQSNRNDLLTNLYIHLLELDDEEQFNFTKDLFLKNIERVSSSDQRITLQILLNFCTGQYNKGHSKYLKESFSLYKVGLEQNCLLVSDEITEATYSNIVSIALPLGEFEWTKSFIDNYGKYLDSQVRDDAVVYSLGLWNFFRKDYEKTVDTLMGHAFKSPHRVLTGKLLFIRTYTELFLKDNSYYQTVISQLQTFDKYLRNNSLVSKNVIKGSQNFSLFAKRLIRGKFKYENMEKLKSKILNTPNVVLKDWLISKI